MWTHPSGWVIIEFLQCPSLNIRMWKATPKELLFMVPSGWWFLTKPSFSWPNTGWCPHYWPLVSRDQGCWVLPCTGEPPTRSYPSVNVNSAEVERLYFTHKFVLQKQRYGFSHSAYLDDSWSSILLLNKKCFLSAGLPELICKESKRLDCFVHHCDLSLVPGTFVCFGEYLLNKWISGWKEEEGKKERRQEGSGWC